MPIYEYRCPACGDFEASRPMSATSRQHPCPACGEQAKKLLSAPKLSQLNSPRARAIDAAARSADSPEVVRGPVGRDRATPVTRDPRHLKLPRP